MKQWNEVLIMIIIKTRVFAYTLILLTTACAIGPAVETTIEKKPLSDGSFHHSTIPELQQQMASGKLTARQLTRFYIEQINRKNPNLNAIIQINPNAMIIADKLDQERQQGKVRGPLHGIPIVIKDNIESATMATTAGSLALKDNYTDRDAPLITKLKDAGAIILAKSNLSEWANMRSERSSSGWSAVGGQTRNPHDKNRSTCGSSSGSGAAVAANMAVAAIGTETDGSITCPASANGIVGIKPTVGLVSRTSVVPISHTQDTAGPMAKSVIDAAIILSVIQGKDPQDPATESMPFNFEQSYHANLEASIKTNAPIDLKGKRIGILYSRAADHEAVAAVFESATKQLKQQGAILVEGLQTEPYDGFWQDSYDVLLYEFKTDLNHYFSTLPSELNQLTLEKLIAFNKRNQSSEMPYFQQEVFEKSQKKGTLSDKAYLNALEKIRKATRQDGLDKLVEDHQLDAIISVTLGPAWSIDKINGDHFSGSFSSYPAIAGYPHITLPMGKVHHMPVGISVTGPAMSEKRLIETAFQIERLLKQN